MIRELAVHVMTRLIPTLAITALIFAGCGSNDAGPKLGRVHGVVTLDQQPLPNALVSFYPKDGRPSTGMTDSNGAYELIFTDTKKGAIVGEHVVRITTAQTSGEGIDPAKAKETLPSNYNEESELTATVKSGDNTLNFDLKR